MKIVLGFVRGVGRFLYGFLVGDDWVVALAMVVSLVITGVLVGRGINSWWLVPPLAVAMTAVSLRRHARA